MGIILVTGIQAAGKSSVAQALAERLERSVHVRGDAFRRMIVSGREEMGAAEPSAEAVRQLELRYRLAATVADGYADAGFDVVLQDVVLGPHLSAMAAGIATRPLAVVVLAPSGEAVRRRDADRQVARGKVAYRAGEDSVADLDRYLREHTPRIGLWLDTSAQTVEETVTEILDRVWDEGVVSP
jgi:chloramphenicol 3-O-phosphotransferase